MRVNIIQGIWNLPENNRKCFWYSTFPTRKLLNLCNLIILHTCFEKSRLCECFKHKGGIQFGNVEIEKSNDIMRAAPCCGGNLVVRLWTHADFSRQTIAEAASIHNRAYCIVIAFSHFWCLFSDRYCMTLKMSFLQICTWNRLGIWEAYR